MPVRICSKSFDVKKRFIHLSAIVSIILASEEKYGDAFANIFDGGEDDLSSQALNQLAALGVTLGLALVGGKCSSACVHSILVDSQALSLASSCAGRCAVHRTNMKPSRTAYGGSCPTMSPMRTVCERSSLLPNPIPYALGAHALKGSELEPFK